MSFSMNAGSHSLSPEPRLRQSHRPQTAGKVQPTHLSCVFEPPTSEAESPPSWAPTGPGSQRTTHQPSPDPGSPVSLGTHPPPAKPRPSELTRGHPNMKWAGVKCSGHSVPTSRHTEDSKHPCLLRSHFCVCTLSLLLLQAGAGTPAERGRTWHQQILLAAPA